MKNTPLYRVMIRNIDTGEEYVPSRYEVSTKVYSRRGSAIQAAKRLTSYYRNYPYGGRENLEGIVIETETNWREVLL